ncbi:MAG: tryptophan synthase subunit alpha [Acidimicrobiia bacterium]|nr:tryptophan synthase subunit alpha [Acidimicrobiia bacterium]
MSKQRLADLFADCRAQDRAALLPYMTAGLPTPSHSVELFTAMANAGADGFEVGIPYADPLMDGPTIQAAGDRALEAGSGVRVGLDILEEVVSTAGKPSVVMTYVNPILRMGIDDFADRVATAGGSAVIIADLPVDEAEVFTAAFNRRGIGLVLFIAPTTTEERLERVVGANPPFIYCIADLGVTGQRATASDHIEELVARVRQKTDTPIVAGVGISSPEQANVAARVADGVIVGSALVREVLDASDAAGAAAALYSAVAAYAAAVRRTSTN